MWPSAVLPIWMIKIHTLAAWLYHVYIGILSLKRKKRSEHFLLLSFPTEICEMNDGCFEFWLDSNFGIKQSEK